MKRRKSTPTKRLKPLPAAHGWDATLIRLKIGQQIRINDWCVSADGQPVRVIAESGIKVTKDHWPHYHIEIQKQANAKLTDRQPTDK